MLRIEEREGCGKLLVATQDMLPGTVVLKEAPVMTIPKEYVERYKGHTLPDLEPCLAAFSVFQKYMNAEQRLKYLGMFGPATGGFAEQMRNLAKKSLRHCVGPTQQDVRPMNEAEQELFVRVSSIVRLNAFQSENGALVVYENACRMLHSCVPNCEWTIEREDMIIRAMVSIKKGDDLTIDYSQGMAMETTAERRHKCLMLKDFTCHCTRCEAPGDDTRQFDCFDPTCLGRHYACQPLSDKPLAYSDQRYTGVEYVEPYLLPCTNCQRPPPVEYQARMLAEEKRWEAQLGKWETEVPSVLAAGHEKVHAQFRELEAMKMPRWHRCTMRLSNLHGRLSLSMARGLPAPDTKTVPKFHMKIQPVLHALQISESICSYPHRDREEELFAVMTCYVYVGDAAATMALCLRVIRMHLLRCGRENRREEADRRRVELLLQGQPANSSGSLGDGVKGCCAFCEESPERAAMKLSLCGRCRKVSYCSVGCQKAHWPVHKQKCKKA